MAYVAVSGGEEAIAASIQLLDYYRSGTEKDLELEAIVEKFGLLVDKVMSGLQLNLPLEIQLSRMWSLYYLQLHWIVELRHRKFIEPYFLFRV